MNILIDAHVFDDKYQGTRTYLKGLYTALIPIAKDWNFYFAASDIEHLKNEFGTAKNVHYLKLSSKNKFYRLLFNFPKLIKKNNIDYSHFQYISPFIKQKKYITTIHDILFKEKIFQDYFPLKYKLVNNLFFKYSAKQADILLSVSEYSKQKINQYYKIPKSKIFVTPNAVSSDFTKTDRTSETIKQKYNLDKYILYVSRIEPRKNHLALIKAFNELKLIDKGYQLVFIGAFDIASKKLEEYKIANKKSLQNKVLWLEGINYKELKSFYKHCNLFVFPSFAEGFGIPPLEAMAMDVKLLCSKATAMQDFGFPDNITFDPSNVEELKIKMDNLLSTPHTKNSDFRTKILSKYNWEVIAKNYYDLVNNDYKK